MNALGGETCPGHQVTVRPALYQERDYLVALGNKAFYCYGPYEPMLSRWFDSDAVLTLVALMAKDPAGFAMLDGLEHEWYLPRIAELLAIAVEPAKRGLGLGYRLMEALEKWARDRGIETLILHTAVDNIPGQRLFDKCGFVRYEIKRHFYPAGQHALMMYKNII